MAFKLNIKNIGKLTDAKIEIGQFTVFAGPNNTGKSFVSKVLYSLFNAMNANHAEVYIQNLTWPIRNSIRRLMRPDRSTGSDVLYPLLTKIENLENVFKDFTIEDIDGLNKSIPSLSKNVKNMQEKLPDIRAQIKSMWKQQDSLHMMEDDLNNIEQALIKLHKALSKISAIDYIFEGIWRKAIENLIQNFQIPKFSDLSNKEDALSEINIEGFGKFEFLNEKIGFNIEPAGFHQLQEYSRVIYLESPVYWKLKSALESIRLSPRFHFSKRARLSGVPGYFYDLALALREEYTGDMDFPDLYERLTGKEVINGKIALSENGDLSFQENGRSFSLPVAAMGVVNLGILALLIERKVLDEGSFIFIDEPEAHLHPAWQVIMAEILFELAKGGVNVVIATHSADILKWLEVHVKKNPDDENMIALNKFPANGDEADKLSFKDKIAEIKEELTKPFADLFTAGL